MSSARADDRIRLLPSVPPDQTQTVVVPGLRPTAMQRLLQSPATGVRLARALKQQMRRQDRMSNSTALQAWSDHLLDAIEGVAELSWLRWLEPARTWLPYFVLLSVPVVGWLGLGLVGLAKLQHLLMGALDLGDGSNRVSARELRALLVQLERTRHLPTRRVLEQELLNWAARVDGTYTHRSRGSVSFDPDARQLLSQLRFGLERLTPEDRHAVKQLTRALEVVVRARVDMERAAASHAAQRDALSRSRWSGRRSLERRIDGTELEIEYQSFARKVFEIILLMDERQPRAWSVFAAEAMPPPS